MEKEKDVTYTRFDISSLFPKFVINSQGIAEPFEISDIKLRLQIDTGIDEAIAQIISDNVIRKIISDGKKEVDSSYIRDLVCTELSAMGLDKYKALFSVEDSRFFLDKAFIEQFNNKQPNWGPLGYITYKRTYSRIKEDGFKEEFWETVVRVVEGVYSIQKTHVKGLELPWDKEKAQRSAQQMFMKIWEFKFLPPGRGLWIMGTDFVRRHGSMALNNCFEYNTEIITKNGVKKIGECVNTEQILLSKNGKWVKAPIKKFGVQKLVKLTVKRARVTKEIYCTADHIWYAKSRKQPYRKDGFMKFKTTDLPINAHLSYVYGQGINGIVRPSPYGIAHGIVYGDGNTGDSNCWVYLCGDKKELVHYFPLNEKTEDENVSNDGAIRVADIPKFFRQLPSLNENKSYLYGWLCGYFSADGSCDINGNCTISSSKKKDILFVRDVCIILGIGYYSIKKSKRDKELGGKIYKDHVMYGLTFMPSTLSKDFFLRTIHKNNFVKEKKKLRWKVESIEETNRKEEVYCAIVPEYHTFTLEGNILTGNCSFISTENIDISFSRPFEFTMDALMLGVGVGFDTLGAGKLEIKQPAPGTFDYDIPDNREGWIHGMRILLNAFFKGTQIPTYKDHLIRPKGSPIKGFGGIASGPKPLLNMYNSIQELLTKKIGQKLTSVNLVDMMNFIGKCIVSGNVRRCLVEEMKVHTKRGILPIKNVLVDDLVLTSDGSYKKITAKFDQGLQDTITITTSHGSIECTPNHRVAVYDGLESFTWKQAGDLTDKDRLISISHTEGLNGISENELWLIGYYHGDGSSDYLRKKGRGGGGTVSLAMSTENYNNGLKDRCFTVLKNMGYDPRVHIQDNSTHINVYNVNFAKEILRYKKPHHSPIITKDIWNGTEKMRSAYLAGLADSDGGKGNILLYSTRLKFIKDIQKIALSLGIATTLHKREPRYKEKYDKFYRGENSLFIRGIQSQKRAKELIEPYCAIWNCEIKNGKKNGLSIPYQFIIDAKERGIIDFQPLSNGLIRGTIPSGEKYRDANFDTLIEKDLVNPNWLPIEILSIEPNGRKQTYDLEVEENHEFVCEGFLVHNSAEIALGYPDDLDYVTMKDYNKFPEECKDHRWASNNSIIASLGMDYSEIANSIALNGEPGIVWLDNSRKYSRMNGVIDWKDKDVMGVNPCVTGDTLIAVADGRNAVPIKQLAEEGRDIPVYCQGIGGILRIRMLRHPRITGYNEDIYEVKFDNGSVLKCTKNHKIILKNGNEKEAGDLKVNDSVLIFKKWQTNWGTATGRDSSNHDKLYWCINNGKKNIFEHTFIYENIKKERVGKGYNIHHIDENPLNNRIDNLLKIDSSEHRKLHMVGNKNPMRKWFPNAPEQVQNAYRQTMSEATSGDKNGNWSGFTDDEIYNEMISLIKEIKEPLTSPKWREHSRIVNMPHTSPRWGSGQTPRHLIKQANNECGYEHYDNPAIMREYKKYINLLKNYDLPIVFENGIKVIRKCEICETEFKVRWALRERAYCSNKCVLKSIAMKPNAMKILGAERRKIVLKNIMNIFDQYVSINETIPTRSHFITILKENGINDLRTAGLPDNYQKFLDIISEKYGFQKISSRKLGNEEYTNLVASKLKENGLCYNHKIVSVKKIGTANVYNGTVDDFHNYCVIISDRNDPVLELVPNSQCGEQSLESAELCNLCETFPSRHSGYNEFEETLKYAYLYAKSVTLMKTHWKESNAIMLKNRRIGTSMSGIIDAIVKHGRRTLLEWCEAGYNYLQKLDDTYSSWFCVPRSIKITTVKPSGSVSLLPGVSPGIHYPHSEYYIRRIRIAKDSELIPLLRDAGYFMEQDRMGEKTMMVVDFPVKEEKYIRGKDDITMWEQLQNAADLQRYWSDNQVSITVTFRKEEAKDLQWALESFEDKLKSVSLLPLSDHGYEQAPLEKITKKCFEEMSSRLLPLNLETFKERAIGSAHCDASGGHCDVQYDK